MLKLIKILMYYALGIVGILSISISPVLFQADNFFNLKLYFSELYKFIKLVLDPDKWTFEYYSRTYEIVDFLSEPFIYSMQILVSALIIGLLVAFILAFVSQFLPKVILNGIKRILNFMEAVPDLLIAFILQMIAVFIFKQTGVLVFKVASLGLDERAYAAPIITLAILPAVSMFKILLLLIEEELLKDYTEFAKSKGLRNRYILLGHVLKNIFPSAFYHSKIILWGLFSSLFLVEIIFNINGVTKYALLGQPLVVAFALIFLFTPFFIVYGLIDHWISAEESVGKPIGKKRRFLVGKKKNREVIYNTGGDSSPKQKIKGEPFNPLKLIVGIWKTFVTHMKNWKFATGFLFFFIVISYSLYYHYIHDDFIFHQKFEINEEGRIMSGPPHPPSETFPLGSDYHGYDLLDELIVGAKYTLGIAFVIALARIFLGFLFGMVYAFKLKRYQQKWFEKLIDPIHFLPLSVIALLLLRPILIIGPDSPFSLNERIIYEIAVLTLIVVPLTTVLMGNEMRQVLKQEFIVSTKVLGGSTPHVLRRHVLPHIGARMTILVGQQFVQVLLIFIHLGVAGLVLGGVMQSGGGMGIPEGPPVSLTAEWSGILGMSRVAFFTGKYYVVMWILIAMMLSIFAMQLIIQGVKEIQQVKVGVMYKLPKRKKVKKEKHSSEMEIVPTKESFTFIKQN